MRISAEELANAMRPATATSSLTGRRESEKRERTIQLLDKGASEDAILFAVFGLPSAEEVNAMARDEKATQVSPAFSPAMAAASTILALKRKAALKWLQQVRDENGN